MIDVTAKYGGDVTWEAFDVFDNPTAPGDLADKVQVTEIVGGVVVRTETLHLAAHESMPSFTVPSWVEEA